MDTRKLVLALDTSEDDYDALRNLIFALLPHHIRLELWHMTADILDWMQNNAEGVWWVTANGTICFSDDRDAVLFKVFFC